MNRRVYKQKMRDQKTIGAFLMIISAILICVFVLGDTLLDKDGIVLLFTIPTSLYLIFSKKLLIY